MPCAISTKFIKRDVSDISFMLQTLYIIEGKIVGWTVRPDVTYIKTISRTNYLEEDNTLTLLVVYVNEYEESNKSNALDYTRLQIYKLMGDDLMLTEYDFARQKICSYTNGVITDIGHYEVEEIIVGGDE